MENFDLNELYCIIKDRKNLEPEESYVAKLFAKGRKKIAQKVGEEAVEVVIDAVDNKKDATILESADLVFHLLALWVSMGITPQDVFEELSRRRRITKKKS